MASTVVVTTGIPICTHTSYAIATRHTIIITVVVCRKISAIVRKAGQGAGTAAIEQQRRLESQITSCNETTEDSHACGTLDEAHRYNRDENDEEDSEAVADWLAACNECDKDGSNTKERRDGESDGHFSHDLHATPGKHDPRRMNKMYEHKDAIDETHRA